MPSSSEVFRAQCACGRTELEGRGAPMMTLVCYCDDCQEAGRQIDAQPGGHSGMRADGGTLSTMFRKDRVHVARGREFLVEHKLRPTSHATRVIASCCNSNMLTRFDNWYPMVAVRTFASDAQSLRPERCIQTKFAPDASKIAFTTPRHPGVAPSLVMKLLVATAQLGFQRVATNAGSHS
jgi:hypothetical protein